MPDINEKKTPKEIAYSAVSKEIAFMSVDSSEAKQLASRYRHNIGRKMGEDPFLYGRILNALEQVTDGSRIYIERAVYSALVLYAFANRGEGTGSIAKAISRVEHNDNIIRRFRNAETADDIDKMVYELRNIVKQLSSKNETFNYAALAGDLYIWQCAKGRVSQIMRWERDLILSKKNDK